MSRKLIKSVYISLNKYIPFDCLPAKDEIFSISLNKKNNLLVYHIVVSNINTIMIIIMFMIISILVALAPMKPLVMYRHIS